MKRSEFAAKIKAQHPEYQDMSDEDLTTRVLAKYPQYADMVDKGPTLPTNEQIQQDVETAPSQQSGGMETAIGTALTGGLGGIFPKIAQQLGRGTEDASARMVLNATSGNRPAEDTAAMNAQLNPETMAEQVGQFVPSAALAATGGPIATGLGVAADTGSLKTGLAAGATAGLGEIASLLTKGVNFTPAVKWAATQTLVKLLKQGGLGALSGAIGGSQGGVSGSAKGAAMGAVTELALRQLGINPNPATTSRISAAIKNGADASAARLIWNLLPAAVAHGMNTAADYDSTDRTMIADSPDALAQIVKKRRDAMQVLR